MCPVTTQIKGYPFEVPIPSGVNVQGVVLADQLKSLDWQAREAEYIDHLPQDTMVEVVAKIQALLEDDA
jgi:mRNA interferase MazF